MNITFILFFLKFLKINCLEDQNRIIINNLEKEEIFNITLQKVQFKNLKYHQNYRFKIDTVNDTLLTFYSINCNIEIIPNSIKENEISILKKTNDIYSFKIFEGNRISFQVKPLMDIINGNYKYNYKIRDCPLVINSAQYEEENKLEIDNNDPTVLYFNNELTHYFISYTAKNKSNDNFVVFSFLYNEKSEFEIKALNSINDDSTFIQNSTNIFLDNNYLRINDFTANISIEYKGNNGTKTPILMTFKAIENRAISILQKNYLNQGFITSNTNFQYFYMEVFKGEEGELILHNKRTNGVLFGLIQEKKDININDAGVYPHNSSNLTYNKHNFKLKYNFSDTNKCEEGCYLLITYFHEKFEYNSIIGFEFTLLARVWDDIDLLPQIINIPFNEYIFGYFEQESVNEHYYSIFVPNDANEIVIQIEGNYFEGFMGEGRKRLITTRKMEKTTQLEIAHNQMIIRYEKKNFTDININFNNNYISFAFRPKNYFVNILSFYYFRIFYLKENNNTLILPLDSNIGNICQPEVKNNINHLKEKDNNNLYYCQFILKNNYNLFSLNFSIATSLQNKDITINYSKKYNSKNNLPDENNSTQSHFEDGEDNNVDSIMFEFEFNDNQTKHILLTFFDNKNDFSPHLYASQIYEFNFNKTLNFSMPDKNDFSLVCSWISGYGQIDLKDTMEPSILGLSNNFKGKPFFISLSDLSIIMFNNCMNFIFYIKLNKIMANNGVSELTFGASMNELTINKPFPLFYYIKYTKNLMDLNFRMVNYQEEISKNTTTIFDIEGYIMEYEYIEKKMKGEYIKLENPIKGFYDLDFKNGLLHINEANFVEDRYLLIKIDKNNKDLFYPNIIQIITLNKNNENEYILPINQYIVGFFDLLDKRNNLNLSYLVQMNEKYTTEFNVLLEFSTNYEDIQLNIFSSDYKNITSSTIMKNENGVQKYRFLSLKSNLHLRIKNPKNILKANYVLRYFTTEEKREYKYLFKKTYKIGKIKENQDNTVSLIFEFDNIVINRTENKDVYFKIYSFLFKKEDIINNEILNTSARINSKSSYENQTIINETEKKFTICFNNISRNNFYYEMQIKVHVVIKDFFLNEEYLIYSIPMNLEKYLKKSKLRYYIIFGLVGLIIIIIIIYFISCFKFRKNYSELKDKVLSISFSSGLSKDIFTTDTSKSRRDEEYESTFI